MPSTIQSRELDAVDSSATRQSSLKTWVTLRLAPFFGHAEANSEASRSRDRYRRAALTGATSILAKVVVLATTIISVPLTFRYLGLDRYGLWMTISSFVLFLGFADLGVGNGLVAAISKANGKDDKALAQRQVSCAFVLLCFLGGAILCLLAASYHLVPWARLYGTSTMLAGREAGPATAILIICTALSQHRQPIPCLQVHNHMLAKCRRTLADVDDHIDNRPVNHSNQFCLRVHELIVQSANHIPRGKR